MADPPAAGHGLEVVVVTDGAAGMRVAERERPDLVLMDLSRPELDGVPHLVWQALAGAVAWA